MKRLTAIFAQGLIAMLPLAVTVLLLYWLASAAEQTLGAGMTLLIPDAWYVRGMGVVAGITLTLVLGLLVNIWGMPQLIRRSPEIHFSFTRASQESSGSVERLFLRV